jgi:hypothetical protein
MSGGQLGAERLFLLHDLQGDQGRGHWKLLKKIGDANGIDPAYQPGTALRADGGRIDLPSPQALPGMNNILNANYPIYRQYGLFRLTITPCTDAP